MALAHYVRKESNGDVILLSAAAAAVSAYPDIAAMTCYNVVVETSSSKMYGRTVVDWRLYEDGPKETAVAVAIDASSFRELLRGAIGAL